LLEATTPKPEPIIVPRQPNIATIIVLSIYILLPLNNKKSNLIAAL
jgi:hypothetical protein